MSLLVISETLRPFFNALTANDKSSLRNSQNLKQPIQTQLSKKQKPFPEFFLPRLKCILNFERCEKKR